MSKFNFFDKEPDDIFVDKEDGSFDHQVSGLTPKILLLPFMSGILDDEDEFIDVDDYDIFMQGPFF